MNKDRNKLFHNRYATSIMATTKPTFKLIFHCFFPDSFDCEHAKQKKFFDIDLRTVSYGLFRATDVA